jgi:selenophosphate synthase
MDVVTAAYDAACESMSRLNIVRECAARRTWDCKVSALTLLCRVCVCTAARLMHKYGAHGATDVTGFGFLGHARCCG